MKRWWRICFLNFYALVLWVAMTNWWKLHFKHFYEWYSRLCCFCFLFSLSFPFGFCFLYITFLVAAFVFCFHFHFLWGFESLLNLLQSYFVDNSWNNNFLLNSVIKSIFNYWQMFSIIFWKMKALFLISQLIYGVHFTVHILYSH